MKRARVANIGQSDICSVSLLPLQEDGRRKKRQNKHNKRKETAENTIFPRVSAILLQRLPHKGYIKV